MFSLKCFKPGKDVIEFELQKVHAVCYAEIKPWGTRAEAGSPIWRLSQEPNKEMLVACLGWSVGFCPWQLGAALPLPKKGNDGRGAGALGAFSV